MKASRLHLFNAYGIELEYMIVDRDSLAIKPVADDLFKRVLGEYGSDVERGEVTWCNELVLHVVELKCSEPTHDLVRLQNKFFENICKINKDLEHFNAKLLSTAAHPFMNPDKDTFLWPHDNNEVYERYNKIFNCKGHGWSNLQSTHINLPFYDDEEFAQLHAAIRLILPILPALTASSPVLNSSYTGMLDKRMDYYQKNQRIIPSITGKVIPERVYSKRQYHKVIYDRIASDIAPFNEDGLLNPVWVNSRGAIARFDRGSIEIRILDIQECPKADLAVTALIINLLKLLISEKIIRFQNQQHWETEDLNKLLQLTIKDAENAIIADSSYLKIFGMETKSCSAQDLWKHILQLVKDHEPEAMAPWESQLAFLLEQGTLATRIVKALGGIYTSENINMIYQELSDCLANNELFEVCLEEKL